MCSFCGRNKRHDQEQLTGGKDLFVLYFRVTVQETVLPIVGRALLYQPLTKTTPPPRADMLTSLCDLASP